MVVIKAIRHMCIVYDVKTIIICNWRDSCCVKHTHSSCDYRLQDISRTHCFLCHHHWLLLTKQYDGCSFYVHPVLLLVFLFLFAAPRVPNVESPSRKPLDPVRFQLWFHNFATFCKYFENVTRLRNRQTVLQIAMSPSHEDVTGTYFGLQTVKSRPRGLTNPLTSWPAGRPTCGPRLAIRRGTARRINKMPRYR